MGRTQSEGLELRLERVRRKARERGVRLDPPRSEQEVAGFEARIGVRLPEEYRRFLLEISDGPREEKEYGIPMGGVGYRVEPRHRRERRQKEGPPDYGLLPLERTLASEEASDEPWILYPDRPFPLTEAWIWESSDEVVEVDEERLEAVGAHGFLYLGTDGCSMCWILVVTGAERGHVWDLCHVGSGPCDPPADFLDWYERWLDNDTYLTAADDEIW